MDPLARPSRVRYRDRWRTYPRRTHCLAPACKRLRVVVARPRVRLGPLAVSTGLRRLRLGSGAKIIARPSDGRHDDSRNWMVCGAHHYTASLAPVPQWAAAITALEGRSVD